MLCVCYLQIALPSQDTAEIEPRRDANVEKGLQGVLFLMASRHLAVQLP